MMTRHALLLGLLCSYGCIPSSLQVSTENVASRDPASSAESCTGTWVEPSQGDSWEAFCTTSCSTSAECGVDERCAELLAGHSGRICVGANKPTRRADVPYDPSWHCDFFGAPPTCVTDQILRRSFNDKDSQICGWSFSLCAAGCETTGPVDLGSSQDPPGACR